MHGNGFFQLHDWLVVARSWWIDECIMSNTEKTMEVILNDDYFEHINSKYVNNYDDLINSPFTYPIYDHYIISPECKQAHGVIYDYKHDSKNEKLHIFIDLENNSPLMFFQEADFDLKKMSILDLDYSQEDHERYNDNNDNDRRRRLAKTRKLRKTISLPVKEIHKSDVDIYYKGKKMCKIISFDVEPYFDIIIGFKIKYRLDFKKQKLYDIRGSLTVSAGIDASIVLNFGEESDSDDGSVTVELFSKTFKKKKFRTTVGPLVITSEPFVEVKGEIQRPALGVELSASAGVHGSVTAFGGWSQKEGAYGGVDHSFDYGMNFADPEYPGSDGRLEAIFSLIITPGITFGLWETDILTIGAPIGIPQIESSVSLGSCSSDSAVGFDVIFEVDMYLTATLSLTIEKIKLFGRKIFKGYEWTPDKDLLKFKIWSMPSLKFKLCYDTSDISETSLLENDASGAITYDEYNTYISVDEPFILYNTPNNKAISWGQANAICSIMHGTQLATFENEKRYQGFNDTLDLYFVPNTQCPSGDSECEWSGSTTMLMWVGLYDFDNKDDIWTWNKKDVNEVEITFDSNIGDGWGTYVYYDSDPFLTNNEISLDTIGYCGAFWYYDSDVSNPGIIDYPCTNGSITNYNSNYANISWFACNLPDIHEYNDKYIGVYVYDDEYIWNDANQYCNDTFGTELATIISETDNNNAYATVTAIENFFDPYFDDTLAFIGIHEINNKSSFNFVDERDSYTTGYDNWYTAPSDPYCETGIAASNGACCNIACGTCGGSGCASRPGGGSCCTGNILNSGVSCADSLPPCIIDTSAPAPTRDTQPNNLATQQCGTFGTSSALDNTWNSIECDGSSNGNIKSNLFVCNRPIVYDYYAYDDFIAVEAEIGLSWLDAQLVCNDEFGSNLASIHSQVEQYDKIEEVTFEILKWDENIEEGDDTERYAWIGAYDSDYNNNWKWIDNTVWGGWTNWYSSDPVSSNGEYCGLMNLEDNNKWFDGNCDNKHKRFLCNRAQTEFSYNDYIGINTHDDDNSFTAIEADEYCQTHYGSHLASIHSDFDNEDIVFIIDEIDGYDTTWIGLVSNSGSTSWYWRDGSNYDYNNFESGSGTASTTSGYECGKLTYDSNSSWVYDSCSSDYIYYDNSNVYFTAFICNRAKEEYITDSFIGVNFYTATETSQLFTWNEAETYCVNTYNSHLASILTSEQNNETQSIFQAFDKIMLAFGFNDQTTEGTFEWIDGRVSNFEYWYPGEPNDYNGEHCGEIRYGGKFDGEWNDQDCDDKEYLGFICNRPIEIYEEGDYIIVNAFNNEKYTWDEANTYCYNNFYGGVYSQASLATGLDNDIDFNLTVEMFKMTQGSGVSERYSSGVTSNLFAWIGLNDIDAEGTYEWIDGSGTIDLSVTQSNGYWANNEPNNYGYKEDCISIEAWSSGYKWNDRPCDNSYTTSVFLCNNPYYIYRFQRYIGVLDTTNSLKLNFWDANGFCQSHFGTQLASINSEEAQNELQVVHNALTTKLGWGVWTFIGLYDSNKDNIYQWIDGNEFNYTNWATNEPSSTNSNCGMITSPSNSQWYDAGCSGEKRAWICNAE